MCHKMKKLATSVFVAAAIISLVRSDLTPEEKTKIDEYNRTCLKTSGAKPEQLAKIRSGEFVKDVTVQKYFGCMLKAIGVINQKGQLQVDKLRNKVPKDMKKEEAMKIYFNCKNTKGANVDETAYLLYKCFWEASPRHLGLDGQ